MVFNLGYSTFDIRNIKLKGKKMSELNSSNQSGIGVSGLLGVAFVVLKLTGFINWSWWWVTLPFWGGLALVLLILLLLELFTLLKTKQNEKPKFR